MHSLDDLPKTDGFEFVGIDAGGNKHDCLFMMSACGVIYMASNTAVYKDLVGWEPDNDDDNDEVK